MQPVAISNRRLVAADDGSGSFRWKDDRIEGPGRWNAMAIAPHEFIGRILMHALRKGFWWRPANPRFSLASLRRPLHSDMTVSGRLFSKTTFDDIMFDARYAFGPRNPPIEQRWFQAPAHSEEET
jgi:Putative transposase